MSVLMKLYNELFERYPSLQSIKVSIWDAYELLRQSYAEGKKMLIAGNGGSAADSEHIVGELMKGFIKKRELTDEMKEILVSIDRHMGEELALKLQGALPAIALVNHIALSTAYLNDVDPILEYAQQINGYGQSGDVFLAISTSGNSANILYASIVARAKGLKIIALTGRDGGRLAALSDIAIIVPEWETYKVQELHLPVYHCLCLMLEEYFY